MTPGFWRRLKQFRTPNSTNSHEENTAYIPPNPSSSPWGGGANVTTGFLRNRRTHASGDASLGIFRRKCSTLPFSLFVSSVPPWWGSSAVKLAPTRYSRVVSGDGMTHVTVFVFYSVTPWRVTCACRQMSPLACVILAWQSTLDC